ncbi:hypothetical protein DIURU_001899 [Diutina rugosa]|uniref:Xylanolytic transcriptional activator regulatory domain-containing protein n=1 Tax=Diutina rugosa TaxID=5481 RepID=A0A642USE7_DIURU|nr:uncharacterized protein DIURU_001899 [Diutina rugosa]KAA8904468.1 hypothetical protein DIURU_001899 [Diutina rugosa]
MYDEKSYWEQAGDIFSNLGYDDPAAHDLLAVAKLDVDAAVVPCSQCHHLDVKCIPLNPSQCVECERNHRQCSFIHANPNTTTPHPRQKRQKIDHPSPLGSAETTPLSMTAPPPPTSQPSSQSAQPAPPPMLSNTRKRGYSHTTHPMQQQHQQQQQQQQSQSQQQALPRHASPSPNPQSQTSFPKSSFYIGATSSAYDPSVVGAVFRAKESSHTRERIQRIDLVDNNPADGRGPRSDASLRKVAPSVHFILKDDQTPQSFAQSTQDVDTVEKLVTPHGPNLVNLYFRVVHPTYPILHKQVFLEKYQRSHREFSAPLLAAVYALAIQWWDHDPQLNQFPRPDVEKLLKVGSTNFFLEVLKRPKLSAVQAGLLLLQCKHIVDHRKSTNVEARNADYSDWVLCSQVVALSEEMGLGLDCSGWQLPKWERSLRKRLAWGVFVEDKWLALKNGRPSHIPGYNWAVPLISESDFPERQGRLNSATTPHSEASPMSVGSPSPDIEAGKKIFVQFASLSRILGDILTELYSLRAMQEITGLSQVLNVAKPLQIRLKEWYQELPQELQMSAVLPQKLCANGTLQLAYFATELTLHRKIITILWQEQKGGNQVPPQYVTACHDAAKTRLTGSIKFVQELKPQHIHSYWHSCSAANFTLIGTFAALLYCSAPSPQDRDFYRSQANHYRYVLKVCSRGFDQAGQALAEIKLMYNQIPGLGDDDYPVPPPQPGPPPPPPPPRNRLDRSRSEMSAATDNSFSFQMGDMPHQGKGHSDMSPSELIRQQMDVYDKSPH